MKRDFEMTVIKLFNLPPISNSFIIVAPHAEITLTSVHLVLILTSHV